MDTATFQVTLFAFIALFIPMPVMSVNFDCNLELWKKKVYGIPTTFIFLFIGYIQLIERKPRFLFKQSFPVKRAVTGEATKLPIVISRQRPKFFTTILASYVFGRSAAFFGTIKTLVSLFADDKLLATSQTMLIIRKSKATFFTANCISVLFGLIYPIIFIANRAMLFDFTGFIATFNRAKLFATFDPGRRKIKSSATMFTSKVFPGSFSFRRREFKGLSIDWHYYNYNTT